MKPRTEDPSRPSPLSHPLTLIALVSLAVPLYFLLLGYFGDDYGFHLSSWLGIVEGWHSGIVAPAWLARANYGLGEPRFYFYPPLSLYLGASLLQTFPVRIVPALLPWISVLIAGLTMLKLARRLIPTYATQAALLYCTSFYMVITLVMRYAIAEALVAALLPLTVLYAIRVLTAERPLFSLAFTALLTFGWLTNLPAAIVVFYVLLFGTLFLALKQRSPRPLILYALAQIMAVGLSAWYLLPALLAQKQLTTTSLAAKFPWRSYTLFQHPHNPLARSLTYPLWTWAIAGFLFVLCSALRHHRTTRSTLTTAWSFIAVLGCLPLLFELPQGGLLWNHLPELKLVAFSFRFLPFLAIALSLLLPQIQTTSLRRTAFALWLLWMLLPVAERIARYRVHGAPEPFAAVVAEIQHGTGGMGEYLPAGVDTVPESPTAAPHPGTCLITTTSSKPQSRTLTTRSAQPCPYEPGLFYFPEWTATIDGNPTLLQRTPAGHIKLPLPAGDHTVSLTFKRPLRPFLLGLAISLLTLVLLLAGSRNAAPGSAPLQP